MSNTLERIIHTRYRYKVGDKYYVLYLENSGDDVIIHKEIEGLSEESGTTLTVVLSNLKNVLSTFGKKPIATSKTALENMNPVLENGQLGIELDTFRMKVGNGIASYNNLEYFISREIPSDYVIVPKGIAGLTESSESILTDVIRNIRKMIIERSPVAKTSVAFQTEDPVLALGQLAIETNTGYTKIGDGEHKYSELKYFVFKGKGTGQDFKYPIITNSIILNALNPILEENQIAIETDTGKVKLGDGFTRYNDLRYADMQGTSVKLPVLKTKGEFESEEIVYTADRVLYETDTGRFKIADGIGNYVDLPYEDGSSSESEIADPSSTIVDTEENLLEDDPILAYGQVAVTTDGTKVVIGDGISKYSELTPLESFDGLVVAQPEEWYLANDIVLGVGQIAIETDTGLYKIGNGISKYSELDYVDTEPSIDARTYPMKSSAVVIYEDDAVAPLNYTGITAIDANGRVSTDVYIKIDEDAVIPEKINEKHKVHLIFNDGQLYMNFDEKNLVSDQILPIDSDGGFTVGIGDDTLNINSVTVSETNSEDIENNLHCKLLED